MAEELGRKVNSLTAENLALKSEVNQLMENSKKLRLENAALLVIFHQLWVGSFMGQVGSFLLNSGHFFLIWVTSGR